MNIRRKKKIVVLGMMARQPVAGVVWQTVHYLIGFQRLGYEVYYVEAHAATPKMFMDDADDCGTMKAVAFIDDLMRRFGMADRWAYHALHGNGDCHGLSYSQLIHLYDTAELLINMYGGTTPLPEHIATGRLVYLGTDPVEREIELFHNVQETIELMEAHCAFFTFGENYGRPDCRVPVSDRFNFKPTRQPVVLDFWQPANGNGSGKMFTTIGSWQQLWREISFQGETYHWSKHHEFLKFIDLPARTDQNFELALAGCDETDQQMLESKGWRVRDSLGFTRDLDAYRRYIGQSRGEFTVAKDQNVRLRSGWFSDRSATYLASGRPVITQETGFSNILPTGEGLFGFTEMDEILEAVDSIENDYERHSKAAYEIARELFSYEVVLPRILSEVGLSVNV